MNLDLVDAIVVVVGVGVGVEVEVEVEIETDSVFLFPSSGFLIMIFPKPRKTFPSLVFSRKVPTQIIFLKILN